MSEELLGLTAEIVASHVSNNSIATADVPALISSVFQALSQTQNPTAVEEKREPAVPIKASVKHEYIVCLEDGAKLKMLKRYLRTRYDMSPEDYRAKWSLPRDYPMVAPAYAAQRKELAQKIGLGRKKNPSLAPKATKAPATKGRGRPKKSAVEAVAAE